MELIWRDKILYEKGCDLLSHFFIKKLKFSSIDEIKEIIESEDSLENQLHKLKALYSPKQRKYAPQSLELRKLLSQFVRPSPWFIECGNEKYFGDRFDEYTGWTVFNARDLGLLINYMDEIPPLISVFTFKFSTMFEITPKLLFNIKTHCIATILPKDKPFLYVNVGDVGGDLFRGIVQLLELPASYAINMKSQELDGKIFSKNLNLKQKSTSLITVFMTACHFGIDIDYKFALLYKLCTKGGYLLVQDHDLPSYQRDKAHLYETFYNLYRIFYNEISVSNFIDIYKKEPTNYMTRHEWISCISNAGFTPIGINILNDTDGYYDRIIMLFQKK